MVVFEIPKFTANYTPQTHQHTVILSYSAFQTAWTAANDTHRPKHQDHIQHLAKIQSPKSLCISIHGINEGNAGKAEVSWAYLH